MWGLIQKASAYIAPMITTDNLQETKDACEHSINILEGKESEDQLQINLHSLLDLVLDYLTEEVGQQDLPCFDYITQIQFVQKIADFLNPKLEKAHIAAILRFFVAFVNTKLNTYYAQITIHRPFAVVASKLEQIYPQSPETVIEFIKEVWMRSKKSPLMLEMMSFREANQVTYPLLDFLCISAFNPGEIGAIARECILYIIAQNDDPENKFDSMFVEYITKPLHNSLAQFLMTSCDNVATIQFNGTTTTIASWIDQLIMRTNDFDATTVIAHIESLDNVRKLFSIAFLLDFFTAEKISVPAREIAKKQQTLDLITDSLDNGKDDILIAAIALIKAMLFDTGLLPFILPPPKDERVDVLSFMPPMWLDRVDGSTSFEAYENDAGNRIRIVCGSSNGKNDGLFGHICKLLTRVNTLPLRTLLSVTHVIALFIAAEASCIGSELAESFEEACNILKDVQTVEQINQSTQDSPEVRAAIIAEFGKEIHATYLVHEKIVASKQIFAEDPN